MGHPGSVRCIAAWAPGTTLPSVEGIYVRIGAVGRGRRLVAALIALIIIAGIGGVANEDRRPHFLPTYCPHLNPIALLWGEMHKGVAHNRCHACFADFKDAVLTFLRTQVPENWHTLCDKMSDTFRVIKADYLRVLA